MNDNPDDLIRELEQRQTKKDRAGRELHRVKRKWNPATKLFAVGVLLVLMATGALAAVSLFSQTAPTITNPSSVLISTNCAGGTLVTFGVSPTGTVMACQTGVAAFTSGTATGTAAVSVSGTVPTGDALAVFISSTVPTACPSTGLTTIVAAGATTGTLSVTASSSYWYCVTGSASISLGTISWSQ